MANGWQTPSYRPQTATLDRSAYDAGLRRYMMNIYNTMGGGLALTAVVSFLMSIATDPSSQYFSPSLRAMVFSPFVYVLLIAEIGLVMYLAIRIQKMTLQAAHISFWVYAALNGITLTPIVTRYTGESLAQVFFVSAGMFVATSLFGYVTKRDLTKLGTFMMMGLIGIIIASIVNIFMQSSMMGFIISVVGVIVFTGLTAYDTQNIKEIYDGSHDRQSMGKMVIMGALRLYLDFINLFIMLLSLLGQRK